MDLEPVAEELYSLPRERFTAVRNTAAARAREEGDRELAQRIAALRRPSTAAWLANLLVRAHPERVQALRGLGESMREAQHQRHGERLRQLSQQRNELVEAILAQVRALAGAAGQYLSDAVTQELAGTFTAAAHSPAAASALAGGRLTTALDPAEATTELFAGDGVSDAIRESAEPGFAEAELLRRETTQARDTALRALSEADQAVEDAATAVRELRARLEAAEQAEYQARRRAQAARSEFEAADRLAASARRRADSSTEPAS